MPVEPAGELGGGTGGDGAGSGRAALRLDTGSGGLATLAAAA